MSEPLVQYGLIALIVDGAALVLAVLVYAGVLLCTSPRVEEPVEQIEPERVRPRIREVVIVPRTEAHSIPRFRRYH